MATKTLPVLVATLLHVKGSPDGMVASIQTPDNIVLRFVMNTDKEVRKIGAKRIRGKGRTFSQYFAEARQIAVVALSQKAPKPRKQSWASEYGLVGTE